jgi:hypothetical protein
MDHCSIATVGRLDHAKALTTLIGAARHKEAAAAGEEEEA